MSNYSTAITNRIRKALEKNDWQFTFDNDSGIFLFSLGLKGMLKKINYAISVNEDGFILYVLSPIGVNLDNKIMLANMEDFVCRINNGLSMGNFEIDFRNGTIMYKVDTYCKNIKPSYEMIERSIYGASILFQHYGNAFAEIIYNSTTGIDAYIKYGVLKDS